MLILGLTGGIATGKSTVSKRLRDHYQIPVVDADVVAREVVEPGTPAYRGIVDYFDGITPHLLNEDKTLNRGALGRTVFENEEHRKKLNSIVHPAVRKSMAFQVLKAWLTGHSICVLDVPLLFESKLDRFCGTTIVVSCDDDKQLKRLLLRDKELTETDAKNRMASQMRVRDKAKLADIVVDNNGTIDELYLQVDDAINKVRPSKIKTLLTLFPPIGLLFAAISYFSR